MSSKTPDCQLSVMSAWVIKTWHRGLDNSLFYYTHTIKYLYISVNITFFNCISYTEKNLFFFFHHHFQKNKVKHHFQEIKFQQ